MTPLPLQPLVGVGPLRLGATREANRAALAAVLGREVGGGGTGPGLDALLGGALELEYDDEGLCAFIGVSPTADGPRVTFQGLDLAGPAEPLFAAVAALEPSPPAFTPSQQLFPTSVVTLWEAHPRFDLGGGRWPAWGQVGVGTRAYLAGLLAISAGA